jgi:iron-sulfur cluster assembly accessory protein
LTHLAQGDIIWGQIRRAPPIGGRPILSDFEPESEDEGMIDQTQQTAAEAEATSEEAYLDSLLGGSGPSAAAPAEVSLVTLTATAAAKVQALLEQEQDAALGLRVFVAGGGCSGLQYGMTLDETQEGDSVLALDGVRVLVDEMSAQYLAGSEIDYVDSLMGAGFTVTNPNAVSTCGCGHSFKTAADSGQARACGCGN